MRLRTVFDFISDKAAFLNRDTPGDSKESAFEVEASNPRLLPVTSTKIVSTERVTSPLRDLITRF